MTMTDPGVPAAVASSAAALAEEQWRVATLVRAAEVRGRWDAVLPDGARWRLVRSGHFGEYEAELDWTPREVVGHLRDSARVFTASGSKCSLLSRNSIASLMFCTPMISRLLTMAASRAF